MDMEKEQKNSRGMVSDRRRPARQLRNSRPGQPLFWHFPLPPPLFFLLRFGFTVITMNSQFSYLSPMAVVLLHLATILVLKLALFSCNLPQWIHPFKEQDSVTSSKVYDPHRSPVLEHSITSKMMSPSGWQASLSSPPRGSAITNRLPTPTDLSFIDIIQVESLLHQQAWFCGDTCVGVCHSLPHQMVSPCLGRMVWCFHQADGD